jgi:hypothetical protein
MACASVKPPRQGGFQSANGNKSCARLWISILLVFSLTFVLPSITSVWAKATRPVLCRRRRRSDAARASA